MVADHKYVIDGKTFNVGDTLPELGSLIFTSGGYGQICQIEGNSADLSKLPTDVKQGSSAYFVDNGKVYKFDETNKQWVEQ